MSKKEANAKATEHDSEEDDKYQKHEDQKHEDHGVFADAELKLSPVYI